MDLPSACQHLHLTAKTLKEAWDVAKPNHQGVADLYKRLKDEVCPVLRGAVRNSLLQVSRGGVGGNGTAAGVVGIIAQLADVWAECRSVVWEYVILPRAGQVFHRLDVPSLLAKAAGGLDTCIEDVNRTINVDNIVPPAELSEAVQPQLEDADKALKGLEELVNAMRVDKQMVRTRAKAHQAIQALKTLPQSDPAWAQALTTLKGTPRNYRGDEVVLQLGGIPTIMSHIHTNNQAAQTQVLDCLAQMAFCSTNIARALIQSGYFTALVSILNSSTAPDDVKTSIALSFENLASYDQAHQAILNAAGLQALEGLMTTSSSASRRATFASIVLLLCSKVGSAHGQQAVQGFVTRAAAHLVGYLKSGGDNELLRTAMLAFEPLYRYGEAAHLELASQAGFVPALLAVLQRPGGHETVLSCALECVRWVTAQAPGWTDFLAAGGVHTLLGQLTQHAGAEDYQVQHLQEEVVRLLARLYNQSAENKQVLLQAGTASALLSTLRGSANANLNAQCASLLLAIVAADPGSQRMVIGSDVLHLTVAYMYLEQTIKEEEDVINEDQVSSGEGGTGVESLAGRGDGAHEAEEDGAINVIQNGTADGACRQKDAHAEEDAAIINEDNGTCAQEEENAIKHEVIRGTGDDPVESKVESMEEDVGMEEDVHISAPGSAEAVVEGDMAGGAGVDIGHNEGDMEGGVQAVADADVVDDADEVQHEQAVEVVADVEDDALLMSQQAATSKKLFALCARDVAPLLGLISSRSKRVVESKPIDDTDYYSNFVFSKRVEDLQIIVRLLTHLASRHPSCIPAAIQAGAIPALLDVFAGCEDRGDFNLQQHVALTLAYLGAGDPNVYQAIADAGVLHALAVHLHAAAAQYEENCPKLAQSAGALIGMCAKDVTRLRTFVAQSTPGESGYTDLYREQVRMGRVMELLQEMGKDAAFKEAAVQEGLLADLLRLPKVPGVPVAWAVAAISQGSEAAQQVLVEAGVVHAMVEGCSGVEYQRDQGLISACRELKEFCAGSGCMVCSS